MGVAACSQGTGARDGPRSLGSRSLRKTQFWSLFDRRNDTCSTEQYATPCSAVVFQDSGTKAAKDC